MWNVRKFSQLPFFDFCIFRILETNDFPSNKGNFENLPNDRLFLPIYTTKLTLKFNL